jgi:hypothetical protein
MSSVSEKESLTLKSEKIQIDVLNEMISSFIKVLYPLKNEEELTSIKNKFLRSMITKNKDTEMTLHLSSPNVVTSFSLLEEKSSVEPESVLYRIIDDSLKEAMFGLPIEQKKVEIYNEIFIPSSQYGIIKVKLPIITIDIPKTNQILDFIKLIQSFVTNNDPLDTIISYNHLETIEKGTTPYFNWKYSCVQDGIDRYVKNNNQKSGEEERKIPNIKSLMHEIFESHRLVIKFIGMVDELITINERTKKINIGFLKKNVVYTIEGTTYTVAKNGMLFDIPF